MLASWMESAPTGHLPRTAPDGSPSPKDPLREAVQRPTRSPYSGHVAGGAGGARTHDQRMREARPGAPEALPARIPRSRAADGPDCTVYTDGSVHEPVHADRSNHPDTGYRTSPLTARLDAHQLGCPASNECSYSRDRHATQATPHLGPMAIDTLEMNMGGRLCSPAHGPNPKEIPTSHAAFVNAICSQ
jgi:hypothetical protein